MNLKVRILNAASFQDSEHFEIKPGLNAFIGINNSGKTALLWSLAMLGCAMREEKAAWALALANKMEGYHRGTTNPTVQVEFALPKDSRDQVIGALCQLGANAQPPPYEATCETVSFNVAYNRGRQVGFVSPVRMRYKSGGTYQENDLLQIIGNEYTVPPLFGAPRPNTWSSVKFSLQLMGVHNHANFFRFVEPEAGVAKCWPSILNSVFLLGASRDHTERYPTNTGTLDLKPDAENLVQVLRTANQTTRSHRRSREQFQAIEEAVRSIFPEIKGLRAEIVEDPNRQADYSELMLDLAGGQTVPLASCGTGVSQITTLLTAAFLKPVPSLFLIDEPHANLHPAAERILVRILEDVARERGHVFCLATHSPIFSSHCKGNLLAVINHGDDSKVVELQETSELLDVLGVTNADLFTYDKVLFVEGESDSDVFNMVLNGLYAPEVDRMKIVDLSGDGKLRRTRSANQLKKLLVHASGSKLKIPVGFLLDSGGRTDQEKADLQKVLHSPPESVLGLLEKPELEDYLLEPKSIATLIQRERSLCGLEEIGDLEVQIAETIKKGSLKGSVTLQNCFSRAIEGRTFRKRDDSPAIAAQILRSYPDFLNPLLKELRSIVNKIGATESAHK
jgi:hypothetical protein